MIVAGVHCDPVEPRVRVLLSARVRLVREGPEEHLLGEIRRFVPVAENARAEIVDATARLAVDALEPLRLVTWEGPGLGIAL